MGTHIDYIIPKTKEVSISEAKDKLMSIFQRHKSEYEHLKEHSRFSNDIEGNWVGNIIPSDGDYTEYLSLENDGFSVDIYDKVVCISSVERFSSLYLKESKIKDQLNNIMIAISSCFTDSSQRLIGAGGMGDTDSLIELASKGFDFDLIVEEMKSENGDPAQRYEELDLKKWFLNNNKTSHNNNS